MDTLNQIYLLIRTLITNLAMKFSGSHSSLTRLSMMACVCGLLVSQARAMSVSWGSVMPSDLRTSYGASLDASFYMQLGFFEGTFTPDANNTADWAANWKVFDQAAYYGVGNVNNSFDPVNGYFARESIAIDLSGQSQSPYADNNGGLGLNFTGKEAYLWTYNNKTPGIGTEWLLARAEDWVFPAGHDLSECCEDLPVQWSVSDLSTQTPTQAVPVWGGQGNQRGAGVYTVTNNAYTLQTFTFIPEPSTALLTIMGTAFALLRRRRQPMPKAGLNAVLVAAVLVVGIASPCKAERIHWYGPTYKTNLTSTGEVIDHTMVFELGLFKDGFVPTADNVAEWSTYWLAAQRANYSPDGGFFTGKFVVDQKDSPFTGGKPAYIWGFRGGVEAGEWILFRKDTWKWPVLAADQAAEARNPLSALEWNAAQATAIVGTIQSASEPFLMKTALISNAVAPKTSWSEWAQMHMSGEPRNGLNQDADGDGVSNLLEYVFGSLPNKANQPPVMPMELVTVGSEQFMQVTIPRRSDHTANLSVEVSSDLMNWTSGGNSTMTISDSPAGWVVRDRVAHGAGNPKRFIRLKAEIPTP